MFLALHIPTEWSFLSYEARSGPIGNLTLRWLRPFTWCGSRTNFYLKDNYTYPLCKKTNVEGFFFLKRVHETMTLTMDPCMCVTTFELKLTLFTALTQELFCWAASGHSDSGVTGIWNQRQHNVVNVMEKDWDTQMKSAIQYDNLCKYRQRCQGLIKKNKIYYTQ